MKLQPVNRGEDTLPFLKWPGGKRWLSTRIAEVIRPFLRGTYYEPFLGGGSVFFRLRPEKAVLSDTNEELINTYMQVRDNDGTILEQLKRIPVSKEEFYRMRASAPDSLTARAIRFLYLNRTAFAGMYRVNRSGAFNVPFGGGGRTAAPLWTRELLANACSALKNQTLRAADFELAVASATAGDTVYCDPTYTVAHNNNGFSRYNERHFAWSDQERLAAAARRWAAKGILVVVSNASHDSVKALYDFGEIATVRRMSLLSPRATARTQIEELLITIRPSCSQCCP